MTVQKLICSENRFIIYDIKGRSGAGRTGFLPQSSSLHGLSGGGRDSPTRTKGHKPLVLQKLPPSNSGQANGVQINHVRILNLPTTSPGCSRSRYFTDGTSVGQVNNRKQLTLTGDCAGDI